MSSDSNGNLAKLWRLLSYARPYLGFVAFALLSAALYAAGDAGRAYLLAPLTDSVVLPSLQASSLDEVLESTGAPALTAEEQATQRALVRQQVWTNAMNLALWAILIVLGMPIIRYVRDYLSEWVNHRMMADVQAAVAGKLLRLPLSEHVGGSRGDFVARMTNDTVVANSAQSIIFGDLVESILHTLSALTVAFILSWQLTLFGLLIAPPIVLTFQIFGGRLRHTSQRRQEQVADVMQQLMQMLAGVKVIKAFQAEDKEESAFRAEVMRYFRRSMSFVRTRVRARTTIELLTQVAFVGLLFLGLYAIVEGLWALTLGKLMAYIAVISRILPQIKKISRVYNSIQGALPAADRIFEVLDAEEEVKDDPDAVEVPQLREGIRYRGVVFSYGREPVLLGIDLEIKAGETVALMGRTGAGKTTMADLLLRFQDPDEGCIELDGIDLRRIQRSSLRNLIAIVTQESFLFNDTIRGNIAYSRPEASEAEVIEAARAANAHEFIEKLPEGYDTHVGELGSQLSGGQRQRVTIARAILRDPQVLIFDEATSALDAHAEQQVKEAVWNLMRDRTVLVIAHRLSTVKAADRIAVIENGCVTMTGTHDELFAREGLYRELVQLQLTDTTEAA